MLAPSVPPQASSNLLPLRPYQQEAVDAIEGAYARGVRRQLLALPTGTGKTRVFVEVIRRRGGRALVLVHRDELVRQAVDTITRCAPEMSVGIVQADRNQHDQQVVVASVQTISRSRRLAQVAQDFRTVVCDESHHAPADSYKRVLGAMTGASTLVLGVTATPYRGDGVGLADLFDEIVFERDILAMIREGWLADLRAIEVRLAASFEHLRTVGGDFRADDLEHLLRHASAPKHVVRAYQEHAAGRRALAFTPTVAVAHELAAEFQRAGVAAQALDASTPLEDRRAMLKRFRQGEISVIANCGILTEGFDEPSVDAVIVARPTKSKTLYVQMIGRGTRRLAGKDDCLVIDVVGATTRHDLVNMASLYGVTRGESVIEAHARQQAEREAAALAEDERVKLVAKNVDLARQRKLRWAADSNLFVLGLGRQHGDIDIDADDVAADQWTVIRVGSRDHGSPERVLAARVSLERATEIAEAEARTLDVRAFTDPSAAWLDGEPSPAQVTACKRLGISVTPGMTKGQVSSALALAFARRRQQQRRKAAAGEAPRKPMPWRPRWGHVRGARR